jgi:hypothetical protein
MHRSVCTPARQMGVSSRVQLSGGGVEDCSSPARLSSQVPAHISGRLAILDAELGQHSRDVVIDRLGRDKQGASDLGIGLSFADQLEHLAFTRGEPEWMRPGRSARADRHRPGAYLAQLLAGEAGQPPGSATDAVADVGGLRCVDHPGYVQLDGRRQDVEHPEPLAQ